MDDLSPDQTTLPLQGGALPEDAEHEGRVSEKLMFATDEQLAGWLRVAESRSEMLERRLAQVEAFCQDQAARAPGVVRECEYLKLEHAAIRQNIARVREQLDHGPSSADGLKPAA